MPWWLVFPLATLGGAAACGAAWAFIPAYLQATRGSHVVITTIMFNFIAASLMVWLLVDVLSPPGSMAPETRTFEEGGRLPKLDWLLRRSASTSAARRSTCRCFWRWLMCGLVWALIWRTRLGYEIRTFGANPRRRSMPASRRSRSR
jgi:ABC-type uncharacterized transport system permease subunit